MGRRKEPIEVMKAKSPDGITPGKRHLPVPVKVGTPDRRVPELPAGIEGRGEVEWNSVWTAGFWLKRDQDYHWVEMIAQAYQDNEVFRERVKDDGLVVQGYAGQMTAHPLIAEIRRNDQMIQKCLSILGFSPTDRARLTITETQAQNALDKMLSRSRRD